MAGLSILIPAAGQSRRMAGRDKLLEPVDGAPILRRVAENALSLGIPVIVTLPPDAPARRAVLEGLALHLIEVSDAHEGMAASLRAGAAAAGAGALMIVLPDMPEITAADMARVAEAWAEDPEMPVRAATEAGKPGHPAILPRNLVAGLAALDGDVGARSLLLGARAVALPGERARTDLDTAEDWEAWRARTGREGPA